jgi:hypothetical protein
LRYGHALGETTQCPRSAPAQGEYQALLAERMRQVVLKASSYSHRAIRGVFCALE